MSASSERFEVKTTDLGAKIGNLKTKTSVIETPALLPVIHPLRQLIPCPEIRRMGYEAVMTNAYTTFRRLGEKGINEGIHRIIDFEGTVMTDSGGYQVLEFGSVDLKAEEIAKYEEGIGSDIATILDKPTGLDVSRVFASRTVKETLEAAERTKKVISREGVIWTLPIQGGKYLDLVAKSARSSAKLGYDCYALGSPVEVMEEYDFSLLVKMILKARRYLPGNRPFHLFGAGHPLILPLAVSLGCDMFDSASYMLYARQGRYISNTGTVRLEELEYLGCTCKVCTSMNARELRSLPKEERVAALARHNLFILKETIDETKQAIWEGRLWEYVQSSVRKHPRALEAFKTAVLSDRQGEDFFEIGTPAFKDRGLFNFEQIDLFRPEIRRYHERVESIDLSNRRVLLILPETGTRPFLRSKIFEEISRILSGSLEKVLIAFLCPNFGLVPAELSDIYPLSQYTNAYFEFPRHDAILNNGRWEKIHILLPEKESQKKRKQGSNANPEPETTSKEKEWLKLEIADYLKIPSDKVNFSKARLRPSRTKTTVFVARSYKTFKQGVRRNPVSSA